MTFRPGVSRTIGIIGVAVLVIGVFTLMVLRSTIGYPDEANRVRHPAGFSIIQPADWDLTVTVQSATVPTATLWAMPKKAEGRGGGLWAIKFASKPTIVTTGKRAMHEGQFMGQPAWVLEDTKHQKLWVRSYIFERDGEWYQLGLSRPAPEAIMGKEWTAYIESFRVEPVIGAPVIGDLATSLVTTTNPTNGSPPTSAPAPLPIDPGAE